MRRSFRNLVTLLSNEKRQFLLLMCDFLGWLVGLGSFLRWLIGLDPGVQGMTQVFVSCVNAYMRDLMCPICELDLDPNSRMIGFVAPARVRSVPTIIQKQSSYCSSFPIWEKGREWIQERCRESTYQISIPANLSKSASLAATSQAFSTPSRRAWFFGTLPVRQDTVGAILCNCEIFI